MNYFDAIDLYLKHCRIEKGLSEATIIAYKQDLFTFYNYFPFINDVDDVLKIELGDYIQKLSLDDYKVASIIRKLSSIVNFLNYLIEEMIINEKQNLEIIKIKKEDKLPQYLSNEQAIKVLSLPNLNKEKGIRDKAILETLIATGVRVSELVNIKLQDIDFKDYKIKVNGKGDETRYVPIREESINYLKKYVDNVRFKIVPSKKEYSEYAFLRENGTKFTRNSIYLITKKYGEKANLPFLLTPHVFRHTFASILINNGCDIPTIQKFLGHKNLTTTEIYTHINFRSLLEAYDLYWKDY